MHDYEKLGVFYLGKTYDLERGERGEELILYDSKDLTTHAMIIGMTGSGKTGLGIALLEEAAIDRVPVIALDPKGDLTNLLLAFPGLAPGDFQPWVSPDEAATEGVTVEALAEKTAATWRQGLAEWGQAPERIQRLRESVDMAIYTPGSSAGLPISVLRSFAPPPPQVRDDADLLRERIQATASSLLSLIGVEADPITSREHVLIATIVQQAWAAGQSLDVAGLIQAISKPPFATIGVLDLEDFYPAKERFALAMQLNTLLASPGFGAWLEGEPLDAGRMLFGEGGRPRVSVISIAHLSDRERMFFVSMLLNELVSWMRGQSGTGSLRAILYMDELFGYMPPIANPPSKALLLTLLKQARAFGLGLVLATQNPVDLDYKGLSNIGTWFIGRLQTERDKARVMEGLEGAAAGGSFDRQAMERTLAGLGKRVFLMRNVHEDEPVIFTTRWVMSYLAGPLTREQIKALMAGRKASAPAEPAAPAAPAVARSAPEAAAPPTLPNDTPQYWLPLARRPAAELVYLPRVVGAADVTFSSARYNLQATRRIVALCPIDDGPLPVEWEQAALIDLDVGRLARSGEAGAQYAELPAPARQPQRYAEWEKLFSRWVRGSQQLTLLRSEAHGVTSRPGESEREFRVRLQQLSRERRDEQVEALRRKYASRIATLQDRLQRAEQKLAEQQAQAEAQQWSTAASVGGTLLGALMGRKSRANVGSSIGRIRKESADVERAAAGVQSAQAQLAEIEAELQRELEELESGADALGEALEPISVAPKAADVTVHFVGLAWAPHVRDAQGALAPAYASDA